MQVKDVMTTDLGYCIPEEATTKAAHLMKQLDTGIVPIVASESNKQLLGVVTDRDLCLAVVAEGLDPSSVTLEQCMSTPIVTTYPDDDIDLAINLMRDHQIRRVPFFSKSSVKDASTIVDSSISANLEVHVSVTEN